MHAQRERGKVIGVGVHMFADQKKLNRTLAIDLPFQTFAVGLLETRSTTTFSRNSFLVEQLLYFLLMHTIPFYRKMT